MTGDRRGEMLRRAAILARLVALDFVRSRGLMLAGILVGALVLLTVAGRFFGGGEAEGARFVLSFNLQASYWAALVVTWTIGARQIAPEIENRTLHLILARPVERTEALLVRTLATAALGIVAMVGFSALVYVVSPSVPDASAVLGLQMLFLRACSILVVAAVTVVLSLLVPVAAGVLIAFVLVVLGGMLLQHLSELLPTAVFLLAVLAIPDFGLFDALELFVGGQEPLAGAAVVGVVLYGMLFSAVWLGAGAWIFQRKAL
jgi:ABC-type transport system involved in multi-copper enzyme maturation permease subunit